MSLCTEYTGTVHHIFKQACAAEIAVLYAALTCKQNKRYRTSARLTKTRDRCSNVNNHGTDGQTDRQSATQYAAPPREEGRIINNRAEADQLRYKLTHGKTTLLYTWCYNINTASISAHNFYCSIKSPERWGGPGLCDLAGPLKYQSLYLSGGFVKLHYFVTILFLISLHGSVHTLRQWSG